MGGFGVEGAAGSSAEGPPIWFSGFLKTRRAHQRRGPRVARKKICFEAKATRLPCASPFTLV
jgi:hypothetical protein